MKNNFLELFEKCRPELKDLALTHSSFAHQHGIQSNERIEFLGDSVLSVIVTDYLYKHSKSAEGKLSKVCFWILFSKTGLLFFLSHILSHVKRYNIQYSLF